ncbi:FYN-binding protein 2 isoform X2 [Oryctolagus cuniculus]|uniref:FYN-binding protein 2 isoform X2 n=1 Tax=Oryctolagus cuniculus TaxID=9986 RepID=UPI003879F0BE
MEASWGPAPGEGGATVQVGQVEPLGSGVSRAAGSEGSLASRGGGAAQTAGPRIRLWEAGFVSQILPHRKAMEEERVRNFKELQAKFQKLDAISLLGPTKFPAGVSQKNEKSAQSTHILTNGKPFSSNHKQPSPSCSGGESWTLKPQQMKLPQRGEVPKGWNPPGPLGKSAVCSAENSRKVPLLVDVDQFSSGVTDEKEAMGANSFRDKLWNWEKVSSQKSEMSSSFLLVSCGNKAFHLEGQKDTELSLEEPRRKVETDGSKTLPSRRHLRAQRKSLTASEDASFLLQPGRKSQEEPWVESPCQPVFECELAGQAPEKQPNTRHRHLPKTKPLPSVESLGPPPPKPPKPPAVNLQVFRRQAAAVSEIRSEVAVKEDSLPLESAEFEEPHNYEATISYLRHSGNSINLCTAEEIADATYEVRLEELQQPWKNVPHEEHSSEYDDKDVKGKEPHELEAQKNEKDQPFRHPFKVDAFEETPGKMMIGIHGDRSSMLAGQQEAVTDVNQMKACSGGPKLPGYSLGYGGYVEAVEGAKEIPEPGAFPPSPILEDMYDDVECPRRERPKSDFSNSFSSESEENHEEMYEDIYKAKNSYSMMDLDGKEALKRLQRFFQKEKERFKMKKAKPKENISAISISLPDLELRPQEVIIYDDVDVNAKETKDEDKLKTWKPKFLISKEKKEKKSAEASESFSPRNFFRIKKQNLEKNRIEREEKLFREKFEYDKEIVVINKAIVCSNNTRNGIFDLPITRGEELEVIDIAEQNLVICRNSKGKYGYVLIEHLDFKNQGWSPYES